MVVLVPVGDGFCGWPTVLHLSRLDELMLEVTEITQKYAQRCGLDKIVCRSAWTSEQAKRLASAPESQAADLSPQASAVQTR